MPARLPVVHWGAKFFPVRGVHTLRLRVVSNLPRRHFSHKVERQRSAPLITLKFSPFHLFPCPDPPKQMLRAGAQLAVFSLLASTAAAQICPSGGLSPNEQGCLVCACALQPVYGCDSKGGTCALDVCTGQCTISTTGWAIIGGSVAVLLAIIISIACCCCGCSRCCRGDSDRVVYISNNANNPDRAPFLRTQDHYNARAVAAMSRDPRYAKVGSA